MAIPISATLRPLSFLFDSLVFRTEIAVVWLPSLLADLRRIPIPMPGGAFIRYPCLAGRPLRWANVAHPQQVETNRVLSHGTRGKSRERHNRTPTSDMFVEVQREGRVMHGQSVVATPSRM